MFNPEEPRNKDKVLEIENLLREGDIKLRLILFRHGPKKDAAGEKDTRASYFDKQVEEGLKGLDIELGANVHVVSSPAERAKKTAELIEGKARPENAKLDLSERIKEELEIIVKYQQKLEEKIKKRDIGKDFDSPKANQELKNEIDSTILENIFDNTIDELGKELGIEEKLILSVEDFSQNLEEYTRGYLKHLSLLKNKSDNPVSLNVTHSYPMMCFLRNNLRFIEENEIKAAKDMKGKDFFDKVGGCIDEAGAISLDYVQKGDRKIIRVKGKKFEGYIDYE